MRVVVADPEHEEEVLPVTEQAGNGYSLRVERVIAAKAEAIFNAFVALYEQDRPDWVTRSELDLRPGGRWLVGFDVPGEGAFQEERVLTVVERPSHLAYDMRTVSYEPADFATHLDLTIERMPEGQRVRLEQQGFPTEQTRDVFAAAWPDVLAEVARRVEGS